MCRYHRLNSPELTDRDLEQLADSTLARAVLLAMNTEEITIADSVLADFDFVRLAEITTPSTN